MNSIGTNKNPARRFADMDLKTGKKELKDRRQYKFGKILIPKQQYYYPMMHGIFTVAIKKTVPLIAELLPGSIV